MMAAGGALVGAAEKVIARGKQIAAHLLEAAEVDMEFADGVFRVAGTDRGLGIEAVAKASYVPGALPDGAELGLGGALVTRPGDATFPNGCHIAEVEVDPETGETRLLAYTVVDDVGTVINPLLVKGQIHGGVAQGFGQVFGEAILYAEGQLLTASFQDYADAARQRLLRHPGEEQPGADEDQPARRQGRGEAGTVGALPALVGAVVDALRPHGVTHLDMPLTPERVWAAMRAPRP